MQFHFNSSADGSYDMYMYYMYYFYFLKENNKFIKVITYEFLSICGKNW